MEMGNLATDKHAALELSCQGGPCVRRRAHQRPEPLLNHRCDGSSIIINQAYCPFPLRPHISRGIFCGVVFAAFLPVASALANGADFSNNLFSDFAPILALFGEHVSKQFMARSLGWSDNILFAMVVLPVHSFLVPSTDMAHGIGSVRSHHRNHRSNKNWWPYMAESDRRKVKRKPRQC